RGRVRGLGAAPVRGDDVARSLLHGPHRGAALYAASTRAAPVGWAYPPVDQLFGGALLPKGVWLSVAGLFIGFGARWAGGCTSGHGICGVGRLQLGSLATTMTFVVTAVLIAQLVWRESTP
ncbi:MAG TPA: YeeE/YedE thiosulfate transporter family protein, partial [Polyangia bacterium]|nr:YeeE/YedE thiosulfate transporter family protein [Polyangia bacterium]